MASTLGTTTFIRCNLLFLTIAAFLLLAFLPNSTTGFVPPIGIFTLHVTGSRIRQESLAITFPSSSSSLKETSEDFIAGEDEEDEPSFDDVQEKVWRYVKKPLLRIGVKGATPAHGNSLRQLLEDHTAVKVKVNTKNFGSLESASTTLRDLAVEKGASKDMEIIQMRNKDKMILYGLPGTLKKMDEGSFPPPPTPLD